jgi:hypothetical protein
MTSSEMGKLNVDSDTSVGAKATSMILVRFTIQEARQVNPHTNPAALGDAWIR